MDRVFVLSFGLVTAEEFADLSAAIADARDAAVRSLMGRPDVRSVDAVVVNSDDSNATSSVRADDLPSV